MKEDRAAVLAVDFDNTVVSYGDVLHQVALERRLIGHEVKKDKAEIRDQVRGLPNGEILWQKLQGAVYGPQIGKAKLSEGVQLLFRTCIQHGCKVYIVSHKTEYAAHDETRTNLRSAAMAWMTGHQFFEPSGFALRPEDIHFESTRRDKLNRIKSLGCTHVIDDLEETFLEDVLPPDTVKILYAPKGPRSALPGVKIARTWREITDYVFHAAS